MRRRDTAGMLCLVGAAACTAIWGIDELHVDTTEGGGAGGEASQSVATSGTGGVTTATTTSGGMGGAPPAGPWLDCLDALGRGASADGVYSVDPDGDGPEQPLEVYCDMTTAGGGWTLVYAYTFTNYANFAGAANAVTPRPSWPLNVGDSVPISTTVPLSLDDYNAMDFTRWAAFGSEFLVVSNITHWVRCSPESGSLVDNVSGLLSCEVVMNIAPVCVNMAPNVFWASDQNDCRPALLLGNGNYLCWDGRTNNQWPTHDPCGSNDQNHVMDVVDPQGAIFVRRQAP